ncbi:hypothetical protein [Methylorubrum zatmanii]|uniref:Uncharacterized protein n=1 Tax=Methylorubrum zatmanii TaxID=29429 RepID=A0ABW1WTD1_9HYPH|nr:hypothetical protein [Methylorubrum zatmanii]MBD8907264.1 hypothetical protein [Methylorubrum zatmanii]
MDAEPTPRGVSRPTEQEAARDPAAVAGRAELEVRLSRLTPGQRASFREAVRRCYARTAKT